MNLSQIHGKLRDGNTLKVNIGIQKAVSGLLNLRFKKHCQKRLETSARMEDVEPKKMYKKKTNV